MSKIDKVITEILKYLLFILILRLIVKGLMKKSKNYNDNKNLEQENNHIKISSIDQLNEIQKLCEEELSTRVVIKDEKPIKYELPSSSIIQDKESKNIIKYYNKMKNSDEIMICLGKSKDKLIIEKLENMPNLLIGGTIMSGKTSFINTIILNILLTKYPEDIKIILFDSKKVDYKSYECIPHLMLPIGTETNELIQYLNYIKLEIERRIRLLEKSGCKDIKSYNYMASNNKKPYILFVIDDFSLINTNDEINNLLENVSSRGWKVGIHFILTANHPSSKIISNLSKENFPARLCFKVTSSISSKAVLSRSGAENINGIGNALYISRYECNEKLVKVPYITDNDITNIVNEYIKQEVTQYKNNSISNNIETLGSDDEYDGVDPLYNEIVEFVIQTQKASASLLQRRFKLGYNRAARIMDQLEENGIIGPQNGSKPREVLIQINNNDDL